MSVTALQDGIRKLKCPFSLLVSPGLHCGGYYDFSRHLIEAAQGIVPCVTVRAAPFLSRGAKGAEELERVLLFARESGFYVISDARLNETDEAGELLAETFLGGGVFSSDAVTVDAYLGSDVLLPLLERCEKHEKAIIILARRDNRSAGELQDLVSGDRLVYRAVADLAARFGRKQMTDIGYSRVCVSLGLRHPSDLMKLRKRLETTFFYLTGDTGINSLDDFRPGFDRFGHGALIEAAIDADGDVAATLQSLKDEFRKIVQIV